MRGDRQAENGLAKSAAKPRRKIKRLRLDDDVRDEEVGFGKPPPALISSSRGKAVTQRVALKAGKTKTQCSTRCCIA
jgi:hypothetical protein